jgi:hypothetical protein
VQAEVVRFAAWRDEAEAVARDVKEAMEEARRRVEAVPHRIQEALAPVVESMVSVDAGVGKFTAASALPLLLTPSGLEAARARAEAMGHGDELSQGSDPGFYQPSPADTWGEPGQPEASEWSAMTELDEPSWGGAVDPAAAEADHSSQEPSQERDEAVDEASQQFREFLGIPSETDDEEYQTGHPWGA